MTLNKKNIFSSLKLTLYFVANWCSREIKGLIIQTSIVQVHASAGRDNCVRAGTEEDPGWGVPTRIRVTNEGV